MNLATFAIKTISFLSQLAKESVWVNLWLNKNCSYSWLGFYLGLLFNHVQILLCLMLTLLKMRSIPVLSDIHLTTKSYLNLDYWSESCSLWKIREAWISYSNKTLSFFLADFFSHVSMAGKFAIYQHCKTFVIRNILIQFVTVIFFLDSPSRVSIFFNNRNICE